MPLLDTYGPFGLTWFQWLAVLLIVMVSILFGRLAERIVRAIVSRVVKRTRATWDDALLPRLAGPLSAALGLALAAGLIRSANLPPDASDAGYAGIRAGYFVVFFWTLF